MKTRIEKISLKICQILLIGLAYFFLTINGLSFHCLFRITTGLKCPGCGITRMFLCLAKGQIACAFYYNIFIMTLIIILVPYAIYKIAIYISNGQYKFHKYEEYFCYLLIVLALIFGIIRNCPFFPLY